MLDELPILGVDLGTTYSCVACVNDESEKAEVLPNFEGELTTPSVVYYESTSNVIVGRDAKANARISPKLVCATVKRHMGDEGYRWECWGREYRAEEVSALILRKLVLDAGSRLLQERGLPDDTRFRAVITVPAYFGAAEREATKNAGRIAGVDVVAVLPEPVAAAFAYGLGRVQRKQHVLVYDLGGGTFDVSVVAVDGYAAECVATDGVRLLGGADWDRAIVEFANARFIEEHGDGDGQPKDDPEVEQRIYLDAEQAKWTLSQREKAGIMVTHAGKQVRAEITRDEFERRTYELLDETIRKTRAVIEEARSKGIDTIDKLLLVGGSSRMPIVKRRLKEELGLDGEMFEPDQAIAKGAALVARLVQRKEYSFDETQSEAESGSAASLPGGGSPPPLGFVSAKSLGVVALRSGNPQDTFVDYVIVRNSRLPASATQSYGLVADDQTSVKITVKEQREEESESPDANETLQEAILELPTGLRRGAPIDVTFRLDTEGCLEVSAVERSSGRAINVEVENRGRMSEDEIEQKVQAMQAITVS